MKRKLLLKIISGVCICIILLLISGCNITKTKSVTQVKVEEGRIDDEKVDEESKNKELVVGVEPIKKENSEDYFWIDETREIRNPTHVPDYEYKGDSLGERLIFETVMKRTGEKNFKGEFKLINSRVYGVYEEENLVKVIGVLDDMSYLLSEGIIYHTSGGIIPIAITYEKNSDGVYKLKEYVEAQDGELFKPSIEEFCTLPISNKRLKGLPEKILEEYSEFYEEGKLSRWELILQKHLKDNGFFNSKLDAYDENLNKVLIPFT